MIFGIIYLCLIPLSVCPPAIETEPMLIQAEKIAKTYAPLVAKSVPPSLTPQTEALLNYAPNWFSIDLETIQTDGKSALLYLSDQRLWDALAEIGINAVELKGLKDAASQTSFQIKPEFGTEHDYRILAQAARKRGIHLIGQSIGCSTGQGIDFAMALKNIGPYPELYALIEIDPENWSLLPDVKGRRISANIPWLTVQTLHKMGYIPTHFDPYVKTSEWNATAPIVGIDHKTRRWIYLSNKLGSPYLDWLNPSFGALRIAAADTLYMLLTLGQSIIQLDELPCNAEETLSLTIRKLKGFSASLRKGGVESLQGCTDASYDHLIPVACLHAFITQDASALKLMYDLIIQCAAPKRLIHALEPFGRLPDDWAELIHSPQKKHRYHEEEMSAAQLRKQLLKEDVLHMKGEMNGALSWTMIANLQPEITLCDLEKKRTTLLGLHLTLATFFAWQPGIFSLSAQDLLGAAPKQTTIDLLGENKECLYSCAPGQLMNPRSFASGLQKILRVRKELCLAHSTLVETIESEKKNLLILRLQLQNQKPALLAINVGEQESEEVLESSFYAHTWAIDPLTGLLEPKCFDSSFFTLKMAPFSTKLVVFQPRHKK